MLLSFRLEVSSVLPILDTLVVYSQESLIHPVPNMATQKIIVFADHIPIILHAARRISHGMGIFTHIYRSVV